MAPLGQISRRADLAAGVGQAALAGVGHAVDVVLARVARELDDVDQRRLVVGLGDGRVGEAVGEALALVDALQGQSHGQADALLHDRALQEDRLAVGGDVAGDDLVRQVANLATGGLLVVVLHVVGDLGHVGEHVAANLGQVGVHATHGIGHRCPSPGCGHVRAGASPSEGAWFPTSIAQRGDCGVRVSANAGGGATPSRHSRPSRPARPSRLPRGYVHRAHRVCTPSDFGRLRLRR